MQGSDKKASERRDILSVEIVFRALAQGEIS